VLSTLVWCVAPDPPFRPDHATPDALGAEHLGPVLRQPVALPAMPLAGASHAVLEMPKLASRPSHPVPLDWRSASLAADVRNRTGR